MPRVFSYPIHVQPHHTDYAGVVWHGTYVAWMEEARVACLRSLGINFATWVESGVDLPVIELSLQYRRWLTFGAAALVNTWTEPQRGVRMIWQYDIQNQSTGETCVLGTVTLVPVNPATRKVLRQLPSHIAAALAHLYE